MLETYPHCALGCQFCVLSTIVLDKVIQMLGALLECSHHVSCYEMSHLDASTKAKFGSVDEATCWKATVHCSKLMSRYTVICFIAIDA